jgi:PAS domain S-box-containing protein
LRADSKPPDPSERAVPFWSVFAQSRIPMALVDREGRYVQINDAAIKVFQYSRADALGRKIGRTAVEDSAVGKAQWRQLLQTNELYGERIVTHANGTLVRVSYAAHTTMVGDRWLALFVALSARFQPGGPELIGPVRAVSPRGLGVTLTHREREVLRLVALGSDTRRVAEELCISSETVRTHVRNAMKKTGARTRAQLVALALADGLIED